MKYFLIALVFLTLAFNFSFLTKAVARGGEGAGFGGFREAGGRNEGELGDRQTEGINEAEEQRGPYGGEAVEGPRGAEGVRGPYGGAAVEGPDGAVAVERPAGIVPPAFAPGTKIEALPPTAIEIAVGDGVYYSDNGVYYQDCGDGFCVVADPTAATDNAGSDQP